MDAKLKVDAWGNPFCIIPVSERVAIVSGGPSHLSFDALPLNAQQITVSSRSLYAGPSDVRPNEESLALRSLNPVEQLPIKCV